MQFFMPEVYVKYASSNRAVTWWQTLRCSEGTATAGIWSRWRLHCQNVLRLSSGCCTTARRCIADSWSPQWTETATETYELFFLFSFRCFPFFLLFLGEIRLSPLYQPSMLDERNGTFAEQELAKGTEVLVRKPTLMLLYPLQIPNGLPWNWSKSNAVRKQCPTSWLMAGPTVQLVCWLPSNKVSPSISVFPKLLLSLYSHVLPSFCVKSSLTCCSQPELNARTKFHRKQTYEATKDMMAAPVTGRHQEVR